MSSPIEEVAASARRALAPGGWPGAAAAGAIGFLAAGTAGAVLIAAAKLEVPSLGAGAGTFDVLKAIVMAGLGCLRVPVEIGSGEVSAVPLGALAVIGALTISASAEHVRRSGTASARDRVFRGAAVALPFALYCWIAALVFRFQGVEPAGADPLMALVLGASWGLLFGGLGGLWAEEGPRAWFGRALARLIPRLAGLAEGAAAGALAVVVIGGLALAAILLRMIVVLIAGGVDLSGGRVLSIALFFLAFLPNALVAVAGISLGAPVQVGARVTASGRLATAGHDYSLLDWAGGDAPAWVLLSVAIPLCALVLAGFAARRGAAEGSDDRLVLAGAAVTVALVLAGLALLGEARLVGAALGRGGFVRVATSPGWILLLAPVWTLVLGGLGWRLAGLREARSGA